MTHDEIVTVAPERMADKVQAAGEHHEGAPCMGEKEFRLMQRVGTQNVTKNNNSLCVFSTIRSLKE